MVLATTLSGCFRAFFCPGCDEDGSAPDLSRDVTGHDLDRGDNGLAELAFGDGRSDGPGADLALDTAVPDLVGWDGNVSCPNPVAAPEIEIVFDTYGGTFEEIFFKLGSNQNVTDVYWNYQNSTGLGRVIGEGGSKLIACTVGKSSATLVFKNGALYVDKTFELGWSAKGLEVTVTINGLKTAGQEGGTWKPGGANDADDWLRVLKDDSTTQDFKYQYPGNYQSIWTGKALGVAIWDEKYDEAFGYRYPSARQINIGNGASADGPKQSLSPGTYTFSFAIMNKANLLAWMVTP